jgi:hypothetical protein
MAIGDKEGWLYNFTNEFGQSFSMFAYYAGFGEYKVILVLPEVEQRYRNITKTHLYPDGHICLSAWAVRSLEYAYAKSVLWANGWTSYELTGDFQFSPNG